MKMRMKQVQLWSWKENYVRLPLSEQVSLEIALGVSDQIWDKVWVQSTWLMVPLQLAVVSSK